MTLSVLVLTFGFCLNADARVNEGVEAYYPFNGNANDASGNGHHGSTDDSVSFVPGKFGQAVQGRVEIEQFQLQPGSIAAWFFHDPSIGDDYSVVASKRFTLGVPCVEEHIVVVENELGALLCEGPMSVEQFWGTGFSMAGLSPGWHHLASVDTDQSILFYIDGEWVGQFDGSTKSSIVYIGNSEIMLDEVVVYERELSEAEIKELYSAAGPLKEGSLVNISTRGFVGEGDEVLIGGFVIEDLPVTVVVRALGPSLQTRGVGNVLMDPSLKLLSGSTIVAENDNWPDSPQVEQIPIELQPSDPLESVIQMTLDPGAYGAIVEGAAGTTGVGLVEVFKVKP
jgi:hypothetical protein